MPAEQIEPDPFPSDAEIMRHEVMLLTAMLANTRFPDEAARERVRHELAAAMARLELILSSNA